MEAEMHTEKKNGVAVDLERSRGGFLSTVSTRVAGHSAIGGVFVRETARAAWASARIMARLALREEEDGDYREEPRGCVDFAVFRIVDRETAPLIAGRRCEWIAGDCISDAGLTAPVWRVEIWDDGDFYWHLFFLSDFKTNELASYREAVDVALYLANDTGYVTRANCVPRWRHNLDVLDGGCCQRQARSRDDLAPPRSYPTPRR